MATEKSVIKDSKGCGGISVITRRKRALMRWSLSRHVLADFTSEMKTRSGCINDKSVEHDEVKQTDLIRDDEQVQKIKPNALANNSEITSAGTFSDPQVVKHICAKTVVAVLYSTHAEADTCMILHAIYADRKFGSDSCKGRIIVKSPDTDV
ncbi:unnamed protein product [Mytilus coruscus]|uniref:Uncharacterized protein n=1 Tax=Mytilus coruscus TaxID=42192 RepID=A0A6J8ET13_MYTCO|nr:unnamed protein product [Mytilus coruscus]